MTGNEESTHEKLRQKWTQEQIDLNTQVIIPVDDWTERRISEKDGFCLTALDTMDEGSTYFGGVDVSFPEKYFEDGSHKSVAVYSITDQTFPVWSVMEDTATDL